MTMTIPVLPTRKKLAVGAMTSLGCTHPAEFQRSTISISFSVAYDQIADCWYVVHDLLLDTAQNHTADNHKIIYSCDSEEKAKTFEKQISGLIELKILAYQQALTTAAGDEPAAVVKACTYQSLPVGYSKIPLQKD